MLRLLLDHNFPSAPFDFEKVDRTVRFEALASWRPAFAEVSTEDWIVHLAAGFDGFDGVVTNDAGQLEQDPEVIALDRTRLSVVTWRRGTNDPVQLWGSLLVYMPQIRHKIEQDGPSIIRLPTGQLPPDNVQPTAGISTRYAVKRKTSVATLRRLWLPEMETELRERGLDELITALKARRPPRPSRERRKPAT